MVDLSWFSTCFEQRAKSSWNNHSLFIVGERLSGEGGRRKFRWRHPQSLVSGSLLVFGATQTLSHTQTYGEAKRVQMCCCNLNLELMRNKNCLSLGPWHRPALIYCITSKRSSSHDESPFYLPFSTALWSHHTLCSLIYYKQSTLWKQVTHKMTFFFMFEQSSKKYILKLSWHFMIIKLVTKNMSIDHRKT